MAKTLEAHDKLIRPIFEGIRTIAGDAKSRVYTKEWTDAGRPGSGVCQTAWRKDWWMSFQAAVWASGWSMNGPLQWLTSGEA
jgi:hypothetical protein